MSYQQAERAYIQGNYTEAASLIDRLTQESPDDPRVRLLRGHIYCYGLQEYATALSDYQAVANLTEDPSFLDYATQGMSTCREFGGNTAVAVAAPDTGLPSLGHDADFGTNSQWESAFQWSEGGGAFDDPALSAEAPILEFDRDAFDEPGFDAGVMDFDQLDLGAGPGLARGAGSIKVSVPAAGQPSGGAHEGINNPLDDLGSLAGLDFLVDPSLQGPPSDWVTHLETGSEDDSQDMSSSSGIVGAWSKGANPGAGQGAGTASGFAGPGADLLDGAIDDIDDSDWNSQASLGGSGETLEAFQSSGFTTPAASDNGDATLFVDGDGMDAALSSELFSMGMPSGASFGAMGDQRGFGEGPALQPTSTNNLNAQPMLAFPEDEEPGLDTLSDRDSALGLDMGISGIGSSGMGSSGMGGVADSDSNNVYFPDEFDAFDDFGNLSDLSGVEDSVGFTVPMPSAGFDMGASGPPTGTGELTGFEMGTEDIGSVESVWSTDSLPSFAPSDMPEVEPTVAVEQGIFAPLENASLGTKRMVVASVAGIATMLGVAGAGVMLNKTAPSNDDLMQSHLNRSTLVMTLGGGVAGFAGALIIGEVVRRQIRRTTEDLQAQFSKITQGNFNAQATIYSEDELGQLSAGFNQMARVILATTREAQRKAEEQEQQKEDLQRQVIRLLDDVEGAARGDLTVQAEVTADVLGAVADSFNLTIQNLREIVTQVKTAAIQVNKASSDNETFARSLSSDALRQAEELAVTLNSVQVMTDSIQRVADSAREAEEVARTASVTALRGGEAVEKTVSGILQIRDTVAETTRKVKRLAESSQEISKIVALISQIASRTNLLALNASIEAARAGDAGRGFAIVADEVRQLADRAAKASKLIEQNVLKIQVETSSVMVAMEEGTQQVIEGTKLAEQAKRSLDDIIQVSNRIDQLVRSITADTVEQTETSRQVAQVMQSVELTAQETSQEAQRVSRSLQNLVGVAQDLHSKVERFRVESSEPM